MKGRLFWGFILIAAGLIFMANKIFYLNIPVFETLFALALISWGISIIVKGSGIKSKNEIVFNNGEIKYSEEKDKYDIIFSNATVDLTPLVYIDKNRIIKIDIVFSKAIIKINAQLPALIKTSAAFSSVRMPNNATITFGENTYATANFRQGEPYIQINIDTTFGQTDVIECL